MCVVRNVSNSKKHLGQLCTCICISLEKLLLPVPVASLLSYIYQFIQKVHFACINLIEASDKKEVFHCFGNNVSSGPYNHLITEAFLI